VYEESRGIYLLFAELEEEEEEEEEEMALWDSSQTGTTTTTPTTTPRRHPRTTTSGGLPVPCLSRKWSSVCAFYLAKDSFGW
jgi:hypothetical protein